MTQTSPARLPDHLKRYVQQLVAQGSYKTEEDAIAAALEAQLAEDERITALLEESFNCGPPIEFTPEVLNSIAERAMTRREKRKPQTT